MARLRKQVQNTMAETIIGALQEYLDQCPLLEGRRLNVDYLTRRPLTYMISPSPVDSLVRQYHGGSAMRQFVFVLASSNLYGEDVLTNISNSGFFEQLEDWMRAQTKRRSLPQLPGARTAQKLEAMSTGYLYNATATEAHYQIQCRLIYYQKGEH